MWLYGIDVSNWQGIIDWNKVNESWLSFVYLLSSDGTYRGRPNGAPISISAAFERNRELCTKPKGAYHFARPVSNRATDSANQFVKEIGFLPLPPMLDLEDYSDLSSWSLERIVDWVGQFVDRVERLDGRKPIIYNGSYFHGNGIIKYFSDHIWWIPQYTANAKTDPNALEIPKPNLNGNRSWDIWQFTSKGTVDGIPSPVDKNIVPSSVFARMLGARSIMSVFFGCAGEDEQDVLIPSMVGLVRVPVPNLDIRQRLIDSGQYEDRTIVLTDASAIHSFKQLPVAGPTLLAQSVGTGISDVNAVADATATRLGSSFGQEVARQALATLTDLLKRISV